MFEIFLTHEARGQLNRLKRDKGHLKRYKAVKKALGFLSANPRHNSLRTHEFSSLKGPRSEKVFEAYAEQSTPAAYRIFWYYGPHEKEITIIAIIPPSIKCGPTGCQSTIVNPTEPLPNQGKQHNCHSHFCWLSGTSSPCEMAAMSTDRFSFADKSENGNGVTTISPFTNLPMLRPPPANSNLLPRLPQMRTYNQ